MALLPDVRCVLIARDHVSGTNDEFESPAGLSGDETRLGELYRGQFCLVRRCLRFREHGRRRRDEHAR